MASSARDSLDRAALGRGAAAGLLALLAGYAVTYAWKAPAVDEALAGFNAVAELVGGQAVPTWKAVGWLHLNAHLVATRVPAIGGGDRLVNLIDASEDGSLVLLYALVVVVLVVAGAALARYGGSAGLAGSATAGAAAVVGYLPGAVALALLSAHSFGGDVTVAPDPVAAVAVAGVLYPVVLGGLGGALWHALAGTRSA